MRSSTMKYTAWLLLLACLVTFALGIVAGFWRDDARAVAAPPLSLEGYLDEKLPEAPKETEKLKVDNFSCYVCHGNYEGEELVVSHGKEAIGCIDCHGESYAHRNDEDNVTPPDKMYPPETIDKMCAECHEEHVASARDVIERWRERCPEKTNPNEIVCTDCHYQHRLERRVVVWHKRTGEVIPRGKKEKEKGKEGEETTTEAPAGAAGKTGE